jgi:hypothetical protein
LGHLAVSWGHLGTILGHLGAILGHLGAILAPSWDHLGASWGHLGPSWRHLGVILGHLGPYCELSWDHLGHLGAILGLFLTMFSGVLAGFRGMSHAFWKVLAGFWRMSHAFWGRADRDSRLGTALTGQSKQMTASVGSLPTSETGSGRFSRVAELGALLPASLVSRRFVVKTKTRLCSTWTQTSASMLLPRITPPE